MTVDQYPKLLARYIGKEEHGEAKEEGLFKYGSSILVPLEIDSFC
jgi:hypothetical protein